MSLGTLGARVDAVVFDIDDTIVDTRAGFGAAIDAVARVFLPQLPADRYADVLAMWRADSNGYYRAYTRGEIDFERQRMARANQIQESFGGELLDDAGYQEWMKVFWGTFEENWFAFDDARPVLDAFAGSGIAVGTVTNASRDLQVRKLAAAGLGDVPFLVGVDTFGVGKPDPRVFLEACRLLDADPARVAYVGDELDIDAGGAQHAGLIGVWLDRPGTRRGGPTPESRELASERGLLVIDGLGELPEALGVQAPRPAVR